jgi:magnesium chelatase family protein
VDGVAVEVEVRISAQLPRIDIVGLPEAAVRESASRVRAAIASVGLPFPDRRITVNLAPAGLRKSGAGLDLPIAVGILAAASAVESTALAGLALVGELALDGRVRPVRGALAQTLAARDAGCHRIIVPAGNAAEAGLTPGIEVRSADDLGGVVAHLLGSASLPLAERARLHSPPVVEAPDLRDVRGQEVAKRALEVAAAGGHAFLLQGAPGSGKTMLARRLPGVLPALDFDAALEVTRIHGAAGQIPGGVGIVTKRPFRAPHHSASPAGLLGGGNPPLPGEVSLAHRGVLFLDELPEFDRRSLEALRQVLETRQVMISRARTACTFPADFQFVAAANPCPCGWQGSGVRDCRCDDGVRSRYTARMSGPLLDRIDLHVAVQPVAWKDLETPGSCEDSAAVRERVARARRVQEQRGRGAGYRINSEIPDSLLDATVQAGRDARRLLGRAVDHCALSARAARRVLKVARTIADLGEEERVGRHAVAEALSYRADAEPESSR